MAERVTATPEALELIERLRAEHGPLMFFQSGGCCDGSSPMCLPDGELPLVAAGRPAGPDRQRALLHRRRAGRALGQPAVRDRRLVRCGGRLLAGGRRGRPLRHADRGRSPVTAPGTSVIERGAFDDLLAALARRGYTVIGPDGARGGDRLRRDPRERRSPRRLDRRAGRRPLPAAPPRRRRAVRLRRRPALVEALPAPGRDAAVARPAGEDGGLTELVEDAARRHPLRVPRRAVLRAARDGDPRPRASATPPARTPFVVAVQCGAGGRHVLLRLDGHRPDRRGRLRPRAHRGARRRPPPTSSSRSAPSAAREVLAERPARARATTASATRRAPRTRAPRRRWAASSTSRDISDLLYAQLRAPALGRGRRALPDLRQLHDGLPDLLLHDGRGRHRPRTASTSSATSAGTPASRSTTRTSTAARCAPLRARATGSG